MPPCSFFAAPTNFLLSPKKKKKKKKKKVATFFSVFLIGFLPPWSFLYPQIFFSRRPNAKLADIWYILLLCQKIFRLTNCKFGNMPPPYGAAPLHSRGSRGGRYATAKTSTSLNRHTWNLTEDLISFSLFNDDIPVEERTLLAAKIIREAAPGDLEIRKPTLPTITKDSQLLDFAGGRSRLLFDLLELSTDFLQHDDWHLSDDYKTCKTALRSLFAINDSAERAIALATRFNTTITRDEASYQELLQVVEFHSRTYKCNTKDNLKKFM